MVEQVVLVDREVSRVGAAEKAPGRSRRWTARTAGRSLEPLRDISQAGVDDPGSEGHAGPAQPHTLPTGDSEVTFLREQRPHTLWRRGCRALSGTLGGDYANKNKLLEGCKLHIRGGACIIWMANSLGIEHAPY